MKRITLIITLLLLTFAALPAMAQLDRDGDGLPNKEDSCPFKAGPRANNGCPLPDNLAPNPPAPPEPMDSDGDGLPDSDDQCPTVSGPRENRGCPANNPPINPDTSGGSNDEPASPGPDGVTSNPIPDTDGDGTTDDRDSCPTVWGPYENGGCPLDASPDDLVIEVTPAFLPPALPTDGCYVTSVSSSNVNVRKTADLGSEVIGYLNSGVVYASAGYMVIDGTMWFVMNTYEGGASGTGYSSHSVLLSSSCTEITVSPAAETPGMTTEGAAGHQNPTIEYCIYQEVEEAGVFKEVCYEVEVPEGCVVTSSEAGVFTVDCGGGPVSVNPLFDDLPAEGLQVPTRDSAHGVTVLAWARVDGSSQARSTAEYCIYQEVEEVGVFKEVCYEVEVPDGCWLESAEAGVFTTKCRPEIGGKGVWLTGQLWDTIDTNGIPSNLPEGVVVLDEPVDPLDVTIVPRSGGDKPTEMLSMNFTKIEFMYANGNLDLDLRETEENGPQRHDDGSTTVEYCIYVELYEVGVFNKVCYEVEVPANCVLTTSEAGVYTVVCEEGGVVSLNPDLEDLPALDMTIPAREQEGILMVLLLPAVQK